MATTITTRPEPALRSAPRALVAATMLLVAWGVLAFGSPYPWAYIPLGAGSAALGLALLWRTGRAGADNAGHGPVLAALALFACGVLAQLVPLPASWLDVISPATRPLLEAIDLQFAAAGLAPGGTPIWHPLTIGAAATVKALALLVAFAALLAGLTTFLSRVGFAALAPPLVGLGLLVALIGIVQKAVLGDHVFGGMRIYGFWEPRFRLTTPFGPFVNKNHFAGWMLMVIPLGLGYFLGLAEVGMRHVRRGWRNRLLWLSSADGGRLQIVFFATLTMAVSLFMTRSRSGIACFGVAMTIAAVFAARAVRDWKRRILTLAALAALGVMALSWSRVDVVSRFANAGPNDPSFGLRRAVWHDTLVMCRDFPLTGTGLNTFGLATEKYQTAITDLQFKEAHNDYLQLAAEGGLLLGLPALAAIALFTRVVWTRFRGGREDRLSYWLRFGAVTGIVAIALQSAVEFSLQMPGNAVLFVVLCAAALHRAPAAVARSPHARLP